MDREPPNESSQRLGGGVLLACGALLLKVGVLDPITRAEQHASDVQTSDLGALLVPLCFVLGLCLLTLPHGAVWSFLSRPTLLDRATQRPTALGWGLLVAVLLPGAALCAWTSWRVRQLGYR